MSNLNTWEALGVVTQFGVTTAVAVALGFFLGSWVDGLVGTGILFSLIGAVGGMISSTVLTLLVIPVLYALTRARQHRLGAAH